MLGFEPLTSGLCCQNYTTKLPWQVSLKCVKVYTQQAICNLAVGSEFGKFGKMSIGLLMNLSNINSTCKYECHKSTLFSFLVHIFTVNCRT